MDPHFLKTFLNKETYEAVAEMLDLPSLSVLDDTASSAYDNGKQINSFKARNEDSTIANDDQWDLYVNLGSIKLSDKPRRRYQNNPYLKFINKPEKQVAVWRKQELMKPGDILNASTIEKSKFITDKIIGDFIKWKESICDSKDVEIDETVMRQLFEIGIKKPENPKIFKRKPIPRDIFEPKMMAKPRKSWTYVKKHFEKAQKREDKLFKVSTDLLKSKKEEFSDSPEISGNKRCSKELWSKCETNIKDIASSVWKNKLNYKCVQAFCHYLEKNPQIKKPEYLIKMNMFSKTVDKPPSSVQIDK